MIAGEPTGLYTTYYLVKFGMPSGTARIARARAFE